MTDTCIVVADRARARVFLVDATDEARLRLVETVDWVSSECEAGKDDVLPAARSAPDAGRRSGPIHPYGQRRLRHRLELEKRLAQEVAGKAAGLVQSWSRGVLVLIAEPHMLGLLREAGRGALGPGIRIKELARDLAQCPVSELFEHLTHSGIISAPVIRS